MQGVRSGAFCGVESSACLFTPHCATMTCPKLRHPHSEIELTVVFDLVKLEHIKLRSQSPGHLWPVPGVHTRTQAGRGLGEVKRTHHCLPSFWLWNSGFAGSVCSKDSLLALPSSSFGCRGFVCIASRRSSALVLATVILIACLTRATPVRGEAAEGTEEKQQPW